MLARDYMSRNIYTIHPDDLLIDARKKMLEEGVRHLVVMDDGNLVGIVSLNTIRDAAPSKATDLSIHEIHYLLSKMRIRDVMKKNVVTCGPDDHVEDVAKIMQDKRIGAVPVVENGKLLGILTNNDMFRILMKILGLDSPGKRITLEMDRGRGEQLVDIVRAVKSRGKSIKSLLSVESPHPGLQTVILHLDESDMSAVVEDLENLGLQIQSVDVV